MSRHADSPGALAARPCLRKLLRAASPTAVAALAALAAAPAEAQPQTGPESGTAGFTAPPAEKLLVGPGGVDLRTGQFAYSQTDLTIGAGGENGALALVRTMTPIHQGHVQPFGTFSHNWDVMIMEKRVDMPNARFEHGSGQDFRLSIRFGPRSETFDAESWNASSKQVSMTSDAKLEFNGTSGTRGNAGTVYTYTANDGTKAVFRPLGSPNGGECSSEVRCAYVSSIAHPDGTVLAFDYETDATLTKNNARLRSVTSNWGYALLLEYGAAQGWQYVTKACVLNLAYAPKPAANLCASGAEATASYGYGGVFGSGALASVTDPAGGVSTFTYETEGQLQKMRFFRGGDPSPWLTNWVMWTMNKDQSLVGVVQSQLHATGEVYNYSWHTGENQTEGTIAELAGGEASTPAGTISAVYGFPRRPKSFDPPGDPFYQPFPTYGSAVYQMTSGPVAVTDADGHTTHYDYCDRYMLQALPASDDPHRCVPTMLQSYTDPEGIRTDLYYGGRHVVETRRYAQPGSAEAAGPPIVVQTLYDCAQMVTCAKPYKITDALGNVTDFVHSAVHGGTLKETLPPPTPGAARPETRYEYAQRHAWIKTAGGGYIQATAPVWLLVSKSLCRTSGGTGNPAAPCVAAGDEVKTVYDYGPDAGPNNLLLRGEAATADGVTLRTCYGYDRSGRKISQTAANAGLGVCP